MLLLLRVVLLSLVWLLAIIGATVLLPLLWFHSPRVVCLETQSCQCFHTIPPISRWRWKKKRCTNAPIKAVKKKTARYQTNNARFKMFNCKCFLRKEMHSTRFFRPKIYTQCVCYSECKYLVCLLLLVIPVQLQLTLPVQLVLLLQLTLHY